MPGIMATITPDMKLGQYASHTVAQWFNGSTQDISITELFNDNHQAQSLIDAAGMAFDPALPLPFHDCLGLGPQELQKNDLAFTLHYHPIEEHGKLVGILLVGQDVTEALKQKARADAENARQRLLMMVVAQRELFDSHIEECRAGLERAGDLLSESPTITVVHELFRIVHTIKGGSGSLQMDQTASIAHELESYLATLREQSEIDSLDDVPESLMKLEVSIDESVDFIQESLGNDSTDGIQLAEDEVSLIQQALEDDDVKRATQVLDDARLPAIDQVLSKKAIAVFTRANETVEKDAEIQINMATIRANTNIQRVRCSRFV